MRDVIAKKIINGVMIVRRTGTFSKGNRKQILRKQDRSRWRD